MAMKKFGTIDGYLIADVATVVTVFLIVCFRISKSMEAWFLIPMIVTSVSLEYAMFVSRSVVKNKTRSPILAKDENSDTLYVVQAGDVVKYIDGIKTNDIVYKIPDGVHAVLKENGIHVRSFWAKFAYKSRGGVLDTPEGGNWEPLFNANCELLSKVLYLCNLKQFIPAIPPRAEVVISFQKFCIFAI